jgi:hypothetical protein
MRRPIKIMSFYTTPDPESYLQYHLPTLDKCDETCDAGSLDAGKRHNVSASGPGGHAYTHEMGPACRRWILTSHTDPSQDR